MRICALLLILASGCSDDPVDPMLIEGGGAGSGGIDGKLHVYVIDERTDEVISGATVRVGDDVGTTDATGLASFDASGKQTVTITAAGYRASTMIGINAANLTVPLGQNDVTVPTAHVGGTIEGWDDLPVPPADHVTIALVAYSLTENFDDPENDLVQGMVGDLPANACAKAGAISVCDWQLVTRTGPQVHYAVIIDLDTKGTPDDSDNTAALIGYAVKGGLDLADGQQVTGETLTMVPTLEAVTVSFAASPAGSTSTVAAPLLRLGEEGMIVFFLPTITPMESTGMVPALTGDLAGGTWEMIGRATDATESLSSTILLHQPNMTSTVTLGEWLTIPSVPTVSGGTYGFTAVAGSDLTTIDLLSGEDKVWGIAVFDDSTSFTLPAVSPDPLPAGTLRMKVNAAEIDGWDPQNFRIDDFRDKIQRGSDNSVSFTH